MKTCEHDIPEFIVCPKCHPEKYVLTPAELEHAKELQKDLDGGPVMEGK